MRKIIYYVAISLDGFICGPDEDISGFAQGGSGVEKYLEDLKSFDTVFMGRRTYEFGYKFGLQPGQPPYEHMKNYIFSNKLSFEQQHQQVIVCPLEIEKVKEITQSPGTAIYLCGGSILASWLLEHEMIDELKIKLNPFVQGQGTKLFQSTQKAYQLELLKSEQYEQGLQIISYQVKY